MSDRENPERGTRRSDLPARRRLDRRRLLGALATLGAGSLAGCGGDSGDGTSPGTAGDATPTDRPGTATTRTGGSDSGTATPAPSGSGPPLWTTGQKYGVGTVAGVEREDPSRVWFTLTAGALTEARFPRVDLLTLRTYEFLVAAPDDGYAVRTNDQFRDDGPTSVERTTAAVDDEALCFRQTITETGDGEGHEWTLAVEHVVDPAGEAVVTDVSFEGNGEYDVYALAFPALANGTSGDRVARVDTGGGYELTAVEAGEGEGVVRNAEGNGYDVALALAAADGFAWATAAARSDESVQGLLARGAPTDGSDGGTGDAVLAGRVLRGAAGSATVALGFAEAGDTGEAREQARGALDRGFDAARDAYVAGWQAYLAGLSVPDSVTADPDLRAQYHTAAMTLRAVEDRTFEGAGVASPSVPWGSRIPARDPDDYGYNFVWARDLYQTFTALEAMGDIEGAKRATEYVYEYQQRDGGFVPQNTYVDGRTRWGGEQMDNISFPAVMAYQLSERHGYDFEAAGYDYADVKASADYVAGNGPGTEQERWEEEGGLSPSTIAAEIAGLVCAAALADRAGERVDALVYLATADRWREGVAEWCVSREGTDRHDPPYYFRINDDRDPDDGAERGLANGGPTLDERNVVDAGFLELVRLGVLPADDDVVEHSVDVVDEAIRVETPNGPCFYRYVGDGYGELGADAQGAPRGAPWSAGGGGRGRLWPILTGERGEYELRRDADARTDDPADLLRAIQGFANSGRMIPEQVWDREDPTAFGWEFGEGTGSATPLAWSMAGFVRLAHGLDAGRPVETPAAVAERYGGSLPAVSLSVTFPETIVSTERVTIEGETGGDTVVVRTPAETVERVPDEDGTFAVEVGLNSGRNSVAVVAATDAEPVTDAAVALRRATVSYVP